MDTERLRQILQQGVLKESSTSLNFAQAVAQNANPAAPSLSSGALAMLGLDSQIEHEKGTSVGALQEEPSWLSKLFDTALSPLYGVYDAVGEIKHADSVGDAVAGVAETAAATGARIATGIDETLLPNPLIRGGQKLGILPEREEAREMLNEIVPVKLGSEILGENGVENPILKHGGGFFLDVAADPLTYVPGIGLFNAGRKAKTAIDAVSEAAPAVAKANDAAPFTKPEVPSLAEPRIGETAFTDKSVPAIRTTEEPALNPFTPQGKQEIEYNILNDPDSLDELRKAQRRTKDPYAAAKPEGFVPLSHKAMAAKGIVQDKKGNLYNETIRNLIEDIGVGNLPARSLRPAPAATGLLREHALEVYSKATSNLKTKPGAKAELNPANQANLYNSIVNRVDDLLRKDPDTFAANLPRTKEGEVVFSRTQTKVAKHTMAVQMLRAAEDAATAAGNPPVYWNGVRLRLSELINELGPGTSKEYGTQIVKAFQERDFSKISNPAIQAKLSELTARSAVADGRILERTQDYVKQALEGIAKDVPPAQATAMRNKLPQEIEEMVKAAGLSKAERAYVRDLATGIVNLERAPLDQVLHRFGAELSRAKATGKLSPKVVSALNHKIQDIMRITPTDVQKRMNTRGVVGEMMLRMTTWYQRGDMKEFADNVFAAGEYNAKARYQALGNQIKGYTNDEALNALRIAQGILPVAGRTAKEIQLSNIYRDFFESIVGSSRLKTYEDFEGVTAFRSGVVMADVNQVLKEMGSNFQFFEKGTSIMTGQKRSFKGDWSLSWEVTDPTKLGYNHPSKMIYDIDLAMEKVHREYAMVDTFVNNFGARRTDRHFNPSIHNTPLAHSRGGDYYFDKEVVSQFQRLLKDIHDGVWRPNGKGTKFYARGLSSWKRGVTIYMPSHHIRNMIGDLHLTWWAGHSDPRDFVRAKRILGAQRARYKEVIKEGDLNELQKLLDPEAFSWNSTNANDVILKNNKTKVSLTAGELYKAAHDRGLLLNARQLEDLIGDSLQESMQGKTAMSRFIQKPLGGKAHDAASNLSEYRDHYVRIHHFSAAVAKGLRRGRKDIDKLLDEAAHEVRKWHPDGRDLTQFEQKLRMVIPFYSWTRKAIPLVVQSAIQQPAKIVYAPKAAVAIGGASGVEYGDNPIRDPFPDDQLFPKWIRASGIGPIGHAASENPLGGFWGKLGRNLVNPFGGEMGYTVINPGNPFIDLGEQQIGQRNFEDILGGITSMTSPAFQIPAQLYADRTGTGRPIYGDDEPGRLGLDQYAAEQVPILAPIQNVLEVGREKKPGIDSQIDWQALINYLTAAGITGTSPYVKSAEFEVKG